MILAQIASVFVIAVSSDDALIVLVSFFFMPDNSLLWRDLKILFFPNEIPPLLLASPSRADGDASYPCVRTIGDSNGFDVVQ